MANPDNNNDERSGTATGGYKGSRAIASRSVTPRSEPEKNYPLGNLRPVVDGLRYRIIGLDIGEGDVLKPGVAGTFGQIGQAFRKSPGSEVVIQGNESPSVLAGPAGLATRRAESVRDALLKEHIPAKSIRIQKEPKQKLDPRAITAEQKATMRGATIEVIPPKKYSRPDRGFTDQPVLIERKKILTVEIPKVPNLPDLDPFLKKFILPSIGELRNRARRKTEEGVKLIAGAGLLVTLLPELAASVGIEEVLHFLPYLVEAAAEEYGKEKVAKYVKEKLKKRLQDRANERDRGEQDRFMKEMLRRIISGGLDPGKEHHPLYFLVNPVTREWKSRKVGDQIGVQAGHTLSHKAYGFAFALEDPFSNQRLRGDKVETPGLIAFSRACKIAGVYVDRGTAKFWERNKPPGATRTWLPPGTCENAPSSVGWIDF